MIRDICHFNTGSVGHTVKYNDRATTNNQEHNKLVNSVVNRLSKHKYGREICFSQEQLDDIIQKAPFEIEYNDLGWCWEVRRK